MIHWEFYKKFKFGLTTKWYMLKPKSVLENETHKILWDFEVQTGHLIPTRKPKWVSVKKKRKLAEL